MNISKKLFPPAGPRSPTANFHPSTKYSGGVVLLLPLPGQINE